MTKKRLLVLFLLLISAVVPFVTGRKRDVDSSDISRSQATEDKEWRAGLTTEAELFKRADQTLTKLSVLKDSGTVPDSEEKSADELFKENQFISPSEVITESPTLSDTSDIASTPIPTQTPTKDTEGVPIKESSISKGDTVALPDSHKSVIENERLQLNIVSLEAKLSDQRQSFESKIAELKSKLDIQESENVKLSHQIQNAENNSADAKNLQNKIKELEQRVLKSKAELVEEKKSSLGIKTLGAEYSKRLNEEQKLRKSIEDQLEATIKKRDAQSRENEKLKRVVGDFEKRVKLIEEQRLALSEDKEQVLLKQLGSLRKENASAQAALDDLKKRQKSQSSEISATSTKLDTIQKQLQEKQKENDELSIKLATAERLNEESKGLQQELLSARNELLLAQEQVKILLSTSKNPSTEYRSRNTQRIEVIQPARIERPMATPSLATSSPDSASPMIEVTTQKAVLRSGPGEGTSMVMEIEQGSRLPVETKEGDWYRVITSNGQRAYIRSDLAVELDVDGRQRQSSVGRRVPKVSRTPNANPPDSDPLVELLGRQLAERNKAQQPGEGASRGDKAARTGAPSEAGSEEDEMEAFENLKTGIKKGGSTD